jgi:hypothetical protein
MERMGQGRIFHNKDPKPSLTRRLLFDLFCPKGTPSRSPKLLTGSWPKPAGADTSSIQQPVGKQT